MRSMAIVLAMAMFFFSSISTISMSGEVASATEFGRMTRSDGQPQLNFTYLDHDAVNFGSTAFRVWDGEITIFIEAFPNQTYCDWDPETIVDVDIIIQNHHGHTSHYNADECATVALNTGAYVVGNSNLMSDMRNRNVPSSQLVELSPSLGGKASTTISPLGVTIHAYGMIHTMMTSTKVDTYLLEMPNGINWYHGTCSSETATMNYMSNYPELKGLDVMICDTDMNFGTLNTQYYPETLVKDHDFNYGSLPIPATVYESYSTEYTRLFHNQTYRYERPDYVPELDNADVDENEGVTTTEFDFTIDYRYRLEEIPTTANIVIDDESFEMTTTGTSFRTGVTYHYKTDLSEGSHLYHFEFVADGVSLRFPADGELDGPNINFVPILESNSLDPASGDDDMDYTFSVIYRDADGDRPDLYTIVINGDSHSMSQSGADFQAGVTYAYTNRLAEGGHSYHFEFSDGNYPVRFPAEGEFEGPEVARANYPPTLLGGNVEPLRGDRLDTFTFSITYRDSHGDQPQRAQLIMDGNSYNLTTNGVNFKTGVTYSVGSNLELGDHTYHFEFEEGPFMVRFPPGADELEGPIMENLKPTANIDTPFDIEEFATTDSIILNGSSSMDPEGDPLIYNWSSHLDGYLGEGKEMEVTLSEGHHVLTLTVDDSLGGTSTDEVQVIVIHYYAVLSLSLSLSPTTPEEGGEYRLEAEVFNSGNLASETMGVVFTLDDQEILLDSIVPIDPGAKNIVKHNLVAIAGDHVLSVRVGENLFDSMDFSIGERLPPIADAGADKEVLVGGMVTLDGSGSTSIGYITNYTWDVDGKLYYGSIVQISLEHGGVYNVTMIVTDDISKIHQDIIRITVTELVGPDDDGTDKGSSIPVVPVVLLTIGILLVIVLVVVGVLMISSKKKVATQAPLVPPINMVPSASQQAQLGPADGNVIANGQLMSGPV